MGSFQALKSLYDDIGGHVQFGLVPIDHKRLQRASSDRIPLTKYISDYGHLDF